MGPEGSARRETEAAVVPSAIVDATGAVEELNDARGRRLLEARPKLAAYARALLDHDLGRVCFVWAQDATAWHAVTIQRLPRPADAVPAATVEAVEVAPPHGLTLRELDVLTLVAGGLSNPEIAGHLGASVRTVSTHVQHLLAKLAVSTRAGAAAVAIEQGLLRLPVPGGGRSLEGLPVALLDEVVDGRLPRTRPPALRGPVAVRTRPRPYLLGSAFPLHGPSSADGVEMRNGSALAVAEINARGGIAGRPVEQLVVDMDIATTAGVGDALARLVDAEVDAITTGYAFASDPQGFAAVADYGCPLLSSMTSEEQAQWVCAEPDRMGQVFQSGPTEIFYGIGFVRFLDQLVASGRWRPPSRRLLFVETPVLGGHTTLPSTLERAERSGWTVDALVTVATHGADWTTTLAQIRRGDPAAVMVSHFVAGELAAFQRAFRAEPSDALVYGVFAPSVPEFLDLCGDAAEGLLWATATGVYGDVLGASFAQRYRERFGQAPGRSLAGLTYDQVNLLTNAWARVGNPRAFRDVGAELRRIVHRGVNGTYVLGHERQCALAYPDEVADPSLGQAHLVFQIQDGAQRILDPLPYADGRFRTPPWFGAVTG